MNEALKDMDKVTIGGERIMVIKCVNDQVVIVSSKEDLQKMISRTVIIGKGLDRKLMS